MLIPAVFAFLSLSRQQHGGIMTFKEYAKLHHPVPYILELKQGNGIAVYFGIKHTRDPKDPQLDKAHRLWRALKPTLCLNEDIPAQPMATFQQSVERDGERGALAYWSKQDGVLMRSIDL